jgi:AraC-like DNA-binding protein
MNRISRDLTTDINKSNELLSEQMFNMADMLLSSTYNHFAQVFGSDETVFDAMYGDTFNQIETYRFNEYLNGLVLSNPLIHSAYIYNIKNQIVFSSLSMANDYKDFYDTDMTKLLENKNNLEQGVFIPRQEKFTYLNKEYNNQLITVIYSEYGSNTTTEGAFVLNIDQKQLHNLVAKGDESSKQQSIILSKKGEVISNSDYSIDNHEVLNEQMTQTILESKESRGQLIHDLDGKEYLISFIKSGRLGWSFVGITEYGSLLQKVNAIKRFIVWASILFVLIAACIAFFSMRSIVSPLRRLVKRIRVSSVGEKEEEALNEFDLIARSFSSYEDIVQHLQTKVSDFIPSKRNDLLRSIICDGIMPGNTNMQELGIDLKGNYFQVCLLRIDSYQDLMKQYDTSDITLLKYAIGNIAQEMVSLYYKTDIWSGMGDSVVMILNMSHDEPSINELEQIMCNIQTNITDFLRLSVTVSMGSVVNEMERIRHSWQLANRLSDYRLVCGKGSFITQEFEANRNSSGTEAVVSLEKTIMDYLKAGDLEKLYESISEFMTRVSYFHYDELIEYVSHLMLMTVRVSKVMLDDEDLLQTGVYSLPQVIYQRETLNEISSYYKEILGNIITLRDRYLSMRKSRVVDNMLEIIHKEYGNPDMTVDLLAGMVELSTNYARKIFKEQVGKSLSQYLTDYRFTIAQDLLVQSDIPASKISEMVGILNTNYFYASFKKYCGQTPDQYRRSIKLKMNNEMTLQL